MRILLLSQWYVPEPDIKVHSLGQDLVGRGHQVTVITGFPNYPHGRIYAGYRQRLWQWQNMDGVRVLRLPLYPDHSHSAVRRTMHYLSFAATASALGPLLSGPADVMFAYHPPLSIGFPAVWASLLRRIPFVFEIQDMWPESLGSTGIVNNTLILNSTARLAKMIYRRAAAVTVISPGFKRNLVGKGVPAEKVHVIPNWADESIYQPVDPDPALAAAHGLSGKFNVVFAGNMGPAQALDAVLGAAALLRDLPALQFVFIGDGLAKRDLQERARLTSLNNVRFIDRQPAERMASFFALADVLLVHLRRDPLFDITIPSKTIAYLACARPILMAVEGDAAELVGQAAAGLCCPPEDPVALASTLRILFSMPQATREAMGQAGRQEFLARYTRRVLIDRYEALFRIVATSPANQRSITEPQGQSIL